MFSMQRSRSDSSAAGRARGRQEPDFTLERSLLPAVTCGVDEAGRGPLAGPVVAAAVILDPTAIPEGLNDSKKLTKRQRSLLFDAILTHATVAFASVPAREIDRLNIRRSSLVAMTRAVRALAITPDRALIDGRDVPNGLVCPAEALIGGDARSSSIAAASIVAKVMRDRMMVCAARLYPAYGFERHAGYGTRHHREALAKFGPCPLHRKTFRLSKKEDAAWSGNHAALSKSE